MIKGKIGFEFEGFIPQTKVGLFENYCNTHNINFESDGSVGYFFRTLIDNVATTKRAIDEDTLKPCENENSYPCELNGNGLIFDVENLNSVYDLTKELISMGFKVNSSCGLHIHLSFKKEADYFKLLSWEFIQQFQNKIREILTSDYEKLRLIAFHSKEYENEKEFDTTTNKQVRYMGKCSERYHSVNFNSYNLHHTIEFRIFSATSNIENFKKYVGFLLKNVESFLTQHNKIRLKEEYQTKDKIKKIKVISLKVDSKNKLNSEDN